MIICEQKNCTGCFACMNICPVSAISAGLDENDKTIAVVNNDKCIKCGLCKKICPEINPVKGYKPYLCFAAYTKNEQNRIECSSGGIATGFSECVIKNGGVVFGAGYGENAEIKHICADSIEKLDMLKGSKYVQSNIGYSFKEIKSKLDRQINVLFIGTPCQVAGLNSFLQHDYDNLVTVDLICHGTPPQKYLDNYLKEKGISKERTKVTFRGKFDFILTVFNKNKIIYKKSRETDLYFRAFLEMVIARDNCYNCRYANDFNRPADITIGDFWGLDKTTLKEKYNGRVSAVLINTEKGEKFWQKNDFISEQRTVEEAVAGNAQLRRPHPVTEDTEIFRKYYRQKGFSYAVNKTSVPKIIRRNKKNLTKYYIKQAIKKIVGR